MSVIEQKIEVAADPALVAASWARFVQWAHNGPGHLLCTEVVCVDAVRSGLVDFVPAVGDRTTVIFRMEDPAGGLAPEELRRELGHDLVVFKDYIERSGLVDHRPPDGDRAAHDIEAGRRGDRPRHTRLSSEDDTTFWRSHFPT